MATAKDTIEYRVRATLGNIELPTELKEIVFSDFSIKESPNRAQAVPIEDEDGEVVDVDWVDPKKPDPRFPLCDYYLETHFREKEGFGWLKADWHLTWALTRLRLYKIGRLWGSLYRVHDVANPGIRTGIMDISESIKRRHREPPSGVGLLPHKEYEISKRELEPLKEFVNQMGNTPVNSFEIAVRRFNQSFDRDIPEDRAIDLLIALESLLSEDSEAIRYKIALRAAHLIAQNRTDKLSINSFLKKAYDQRSGVVHGKGTAIKWLRNRSAKGHSNIDELEDIVRRVLRNLLQKARSGTILKATSLDEALFFSND